MTTENDYTKQPKILVADDNKQGVYITKTVLEMRQFRVTTAADAFS